MVTDRPTIPPASTAAFAVWDVRVVYREPTYEVHRGHGPAEYGAVYRVSAASETDAHVVATQRFRDAGDGQTVGWVREIVRFECQPVR